MLNVTDTSKNNINLFSINLSKIMKKTLLLLVSVLFAGSVYSQTDKMWSSVNNTDGINAAKSTQRLSFPQEFKLYKLDAESLRQVLATAPDRFLSRTSGTIISIPNADGNLERFRMFEASNFDAELQARFPQIRSYVGTGIDDTNAQIRISVAPTGIQTMVFRSDKRNEFMEPYSTDGKTYAIYNASRNKGQLPFTCSTADLGVFNDNIDQISTNRSSAGVLKTFRLALSCTSEYSAYFGATSAAQVANVLAGFNATMTRVNGVYEKDFAVHLNIIAGTTAVIYYNAATDPYSDATAGSGGAWNTEVQNTLTTVLGNAAYDIGHLFGAAGGGGNAGCIGCICVDDTAATDDENKGSGFTSPYDAIPQGDNFDIDYVAHEMGHQLGCNHTFAYGGINGTENSSVNVEPGSGSTIMGYAGITGTTDVQAHSDAYFAYKSISQVQLNLNSKTCAVNIPLVNHAPVVLAGNDFTIPKGTPFLLTGSATDADGDTLNYCWEQNDDASTISPTASFPSPTKTNGPNFRSFNPVAVPYRYFPALETVLTGTPSSTWEVLPSPVANRTLNFVLTARDNNPEGGQTKSDAITVTVNASAGPFTISSLGTDGISWALNSTQTITWTVNNTNTLTGATNVNILLSTDGGLTYPTVLASNVPNNGSADIIVPNTAEPHCRIMVKPTDNVFYAISSKQFAIGYTVVAACNTYSNTTQLQIPDGLGSEIPGATVSNTISIPDTGLITDVNIVAKVFHTYPQDLLIKVKHPDGTAVNIWERACGGNNNFNITFNDGSPVFSCATNMSGNFSPSSPLSALNGKAANGTWTIEGTDYKNVDTGRINNWAVVVCSEILTPLANNEFKLSNLSLYPNPTNGILNISMPSGLGLPDNFEIYNTLGQRIQSTKVTSETNLNINTSSLSNGIYLIKISKDGESKTLQFIKN